MKKLVLLILVLGLFSSSLFAGQMVSFSKSPDIVISIRINLHSRNSNCVSGFGFCKLQFTYGIENHPAGPSGDLSAQVFLNSSGQLVVKIADSDLLKYEGGKSMVYFKDKNSVILKEDYELGSDLDKALGATAPLVIRAGEYKLTYEGGFYTMVFPQ